MWSYAFPVVVLFLVGVATGAGLTWWRWKMSLQIIDRANEWKTAAREVSEDVAEQRVYLERLDETFGRLAEIVRAHLRATTPEHLRGAVAKMVGENPPPKPEAGWEAPIPPFEEGVARLERRQGRVPRGL